MDYQKKLESVGQRIKMLREKKGESQAELGNAIGLSQNSISKIEKGDTNLTLENQLRIAEHFNVTHDFLCTGIESDTILDTLSKYIRLKYKNLSDGIESYNYPMIEINNVLFDYLINSSRVMNERGLPDEARSIWLKKINQDFYSRNKKNTFQDYEAIIPVPENLIYPDGNKTEWKQTDLLRELNKQLLESSISKN
ncbi:MAG: Helix-turn-helix domain [Eubacterium sp.]|nr:Helix-turn-helix domain [Eubacterium sp.]